MSSSQKHTKKIEIVDLFCGVGGLTCGLKKSGLNVIAGIDSDSSCKYAYEANNKSTFINKNIRLVTGRDISKLYSKGAIKVLVGCAPCQPFSLLRQKSKTSNENDEKYDLLLEFGRIISDLKPEIISMENVPQIQKTKIFQKFLATLKKLNYFVSYQVINCPDYGIPQQRKRFILLASKYGEINLQSSNFPKDKLSLLNFLKKLPPIEAGEICSTDPLHRSAGLSKINQQRIRLSSPGGTWKDWPKELRCKCHLKKTGTSFTAPYSRISWSQICPTLTTQFFSYGTGRFGHPEQNRALSLREGAIIQTFPETYTFFERNKKISFSTVARQIGNAVPPKLGEVIGTAVTNHINRK